MYVMNGTDVYRIEALLELAAAFPGSMTVAEIARRRGIPEPFLGRLLAGLSRDGVTVTSRGPRGGARLARAPELIALAAVLTPETAPDIGGMGMRWLSGRLEGVQVELLASVSLAALLHIEREGGADLSYEI